MSEVPNAHEDLERAEAGVGHGLGGGSALVPLSIAIMAVFAAVLGSLESASSAHAVVARSAAAIRQGEATDEWSFYQATSVKKNLYELFGEMPSATDAVRQKAERYAKDQQDIERRARAKEAEVKTEEAASEEAMEQHHRLIVATNFVHLAIAVASVSMLVRQKSLWFVALGCCAIGVGLGAWSFMA